MSADDTKRLARRLIIAGFDGLSLPDDLARECALGALAGVILFRRNIASVEQVSSLVEEIRRGFPDNRPPLVVVDQEGGRVVRISKPLTVLPPARVLGEIDDTELTGAAGRLVGLELRSLGFTLNLAPILDVDTNPNSPVIGDRSFGGKPDIVIRHGFAFARGLKTGGVLPCAKHFPGHGDASFDSHLSLGLVEHDAARLEAVEMEPFRAWARTGLGPIMTAHVIYPSLDPDSPATGSRKIITGVLREKMRFSGAVLTDDLEMGAVGQSGGPAAMSIASVRAGADGLLVCRSSDVRKEVVDALAAEAFEHKSFERKLQIAAKRIEPLGSPPGPDVDFSWIGSDDHRSLQDKVMSHFDGV